MQQGVCGTLGGPCELMGGWWMNMGGGLLKSTYSIAFTTTLLAWSLLSFPKVLPLLSLLLYTYIFII